MIYLTEYLTKKSSFERKNLFIGRNIRSTGAKRSLFLPPNDNTASSSSANSPYYSLPSSSSSSSSPSSSYIFNSNVVSHLNSPSVPSHSLITGNSNHGPGGGTSNSNSNGDLQHSYFDSWTQQNTKYPYYFAVHELLPHNLTVVLIKWQPLPAIRVAWDFDSQLKCDAFRVLYHPIASK